MGTTFFIGLNMKTVTGFESYGCFDLGEDRQFAMNLFSKLEGKAVEAEQGVLHMDLIEKYRGLPINMELMSCSMEELSRNVKVITRELFKRINLEEMPI